MAGIAALGSASSYREMDEAPALKKPDARANLHPALLFLMIQN